ncbi:uncharacterized protein METZ01_LOCUS297784 [marine metagenome]|uniref:Methyltransferase domain-containing protein n=1 Tax=marine metagenome TaxID=408172 RepID=A0A382M8D2_9ZZZZ
MNTANEHYTFAKFASNSFYRNQNAQLIDLLDIGDKQKIVDLACGTGAVTRLLSDRLKNAKDAAVIGIDHSAIAIKQAIEDFKDVKSSAVQFVQGGIEHLSTALKDKVDTVVLCNAIHYIPDKNTLLFDINNALHPGGKFAFNTTFFEGAHLPETLKFYRVWMLKAMRHLKSEYGLSINRASKVESRKQLTPDDYKNLLDKNGFQISIQEIKTVEFTREGFLDISKFDDFIQGTLPGVPLEKASKSLQAGVHQAFDELKLTYVLRNWLDIIAIRK